MSQKKSLNTDNSWVSLFQKEIRSNEKRPPGAGWLTIHELREKHPTGQKKLYSYISKWLKEGKLERFEGVIINAAGNKRNCVWYRPVL